MNTQTNTRHREREAGAGRGVAKWSVLLALLVSLAMPAFGSPLDDARKAGLVVETPDGYVKAATTRSATPADIQKLVDDVNRRRRAAYQRIAEKNGISIEQVGIVSYQKRQSEMADKTRP